MTFPSTITITTAIKYVKDDRSILTGDRSKLCSRNDDDDDNDDDGESFISFQTAGGPIDLDLLHDLNEVFRRVRININTTTTCNANTDINDTATIIPYPSIFLGRGNKSPVDLDDSDFENDSTISRSIDDEESSVRSLKTGTSITTSATSFTTTTTTNTGDTNNDTVATTLLRCRRGRNSGPIDLDESDFDDSTIGSTNFDDEESIVNLNKKTVVGHFYTDITSTTTAIVTTAITTIPISTNSGTNYTSIVTTPLKRRFGRNSGPIDLDDSVFDDSTIGSNFDTESKAVSIISLQTTAGTGSGLIDMDWIQDLDESFTTIWNQHEDEFFAWNKSYSKEEETRREDRNNNKLYCTNLPDTTILSLTTKTTTEGNSDDEYSIADDEDDMASFVSLSCRSLDTFGYPNG